MTTLLFKKNRGDHRHVAHAKPVDKSFYANISMVNNHNNTEKKNIRNIGKSTKHFTENLRLSNLIGPAVRQRVEEVLQTNKIRPVSKM